MPAKAMALGLVGLFIWYFAGCKPSADTPTQDSSEVDVARPSNDSTSADEQHADFPAVQRKEIASLIRQGDRLQAIEALDRLIATDPQDAVALRSQAAGLEYEAGQPKRALDRLRQLVRENSQNAELRRDYAGLAARLGYRFDANEQYRLLAGRAVLTPPELIGLIYPHRPQVNFEAKPDPTNPEVLRTKGVLSVVAALQSRGDYRDAIRALENCNPEQREDPAIVAMLGWMLALTQDQQRWNGWAKHSETKSVQRYPAYWLAWGAAVQNGWAIDDEDAAIAGDRGASFAVHCFLQAIQREPHSQIGWDSLLAALEVLAAEDSSNSSLDASRKRVRRRLKQLDETQWLANQVWDMQASPLSPPEQGELYERLAKLSGEQGCLGESLGWQALLVSVQPNSARAWQAWQRDVGKTLNQFPDGLDRELLLCGLDSNDFNDLRPQWIAALPKAELPKMDAVESGVSLSQGQLPNQQRDQVRLVNVAPEMGIDFRWLNAETEIKSEFRLHEPLGGGVACLDYDADGWVDFYFNQAAGEPTQRNGTRPNALFRQTDGRFVECVRLADCDDRGYGHGVTAGDWNQDGWPDLFLANFGENVLWINQGDGTFRRERLDALEKATELSLAFSLSTAIADVSGDHLPDLISINYVDDPLVLNSIERHEDGTPVKLPGPLHFRPAMSHVAKSDARGGAATTFFGHDESARSTGMGLLVTNLDLQGGNEVFVANDQRANHLWFQSSSGQDETSWNNQAALRGVAVGPGGNKNACMGVAAADFNRDGFLDLHVSNFYDEWANHFCQNSGGMFIDRAVAYGLDVLTARTTGFGVQPIDVDNDGWSDLLVANGHIEDMTDNGTPFRMRTQVLINEESKFVSAEMDDPKGDWDRARLGRGVATCDWNRDGRQDAVVTYADAAVELLKNETVNDHRFLQLRLVGVQSERDAIGARVQLFAGDDVWTSVVATGDGYACRNEAVLHFGLGEQKRLDRVEIQWPSGQTSLLAGEVIQDLSLDRRWLWVEGQETPWPEVDLAN
ncbi:FG-GAP-like repeat-containing protein [Rhodopirellula halodulae]|uniref:FG-GAP-like repeat-containing protein n=1 Tax=Rhodopirellula halodulae TaxID=2894198 RepID=UPI001E3F0D90|nr:FG-GAP-like repeat-containing protein [Rhodopirellula sp. JC737]MCC9656871.1 FG-GAP-like repeat-containing protein [Rhodopirellula sp. JC737]